MSRIIYKLRDDLNTFILKKYSLELEIRDYIRYYIIARRQQARKRFIEHIYELKLERERYCILIDYLSNILNPFLNTGDNND